MEWIWEIVGFAILVVIGLLIYLFRIPSIITDRDRLIIQYSIIYRILTLGSNIRKTVVDRPNQMVVMDRRILWIYSNQRVLYFEDLDHIDFSYKNSDLLVGNPDTNAQTARITYKVSLADKNYVNHEIFSLKSTSTSGIGPCENENIAFISDTYGDEARNLVDMLESYTGLSVGDRVYEPDSDAMNTCLHCGQMTSKNKKVCLYCGNDVS